VEKILQYIHIQNVSHEGLIPLIIAAITTMIASFLIGRRLLRLRNVLKRGIAGSQLQNKVVKVFSLVTIIPTIIISVFSILFFYYGIKDWFNQSINTVLNESVAVAESYLEEHKTNLRADAMAMAKDLQRELHLAFANPQLFENIVNGQVTVRTLSEAIIMQNQKVIARSNLSFSFIFETIPEHVLENAKGGNVATLEMDDRLFAIVALDPVSNIYLVISRLIDAKVLQHIEESKGAAASYANVSENINNLQILFITGFIFVTIFLLLAVIWYGINFAQRLTIPLITLAQATQRVGEGDYSIQIDNIKDNDEMDMLIAHFNRMTEQLQKQRQELTQATRMLDQRRRFTETILEGVSAGIVALDNNFIITLCNHSALRLLGFKAESELRSKSLAKIIPEFENLLEKVRLNPSEVHQEQVALRHHGINFILQAKVSAESSQAYVEGFIVALDDITPLIAAQRSAAWSDVARRVAHEIKNPLTPIKLSLDRLKKKFEPDTPELKESYHKYIGTISRHIADISRIVEEFSAFARLPAPKMQEINICALLEQAIFSAETMHQQITYGLTTSNPNIMLQVDEVQMSQVFTNLLKNAAESIERLENQYARGQIDVMLRHNDNAVTIDIADNGIGFPPELLPRIMEPYVSTRSKGTGLGLAIVKKIIEDHKGTISLGNRSMGGAIITISLPRPIAINKKTD
jgi:two-component system, NtrC family, nitrogen regulation sensor histidine kinase NtrY